MGKQCSAGANGFRAKPGERSSRRLQSARRPAMLVMKLMQKLQGAVIIAPDVT